MPAALKADWEGIRQLIISGATLQEVSDSTGISMGTLKARSSREEWFEKRNLSQQLTIKRRELQIQRGQMQPNATSGSDALCEIMQKDNLETRKMLSVALKKAAKGAESLSEEEALSAARNIHEVTKAAGTLHNWQGAQAEAGISILSQLNIQIVNE